MGFALGQRGDLDRSWSKIIFFSVQCTGRWEGSLRGRWVYTLGISISDTLWEFPNLPGRLELVFAISWVRTPSAALAGGLCPSEVERGVRAEGCDSRWYEILFPLIKGKPSWRNHLSKAPPLFLLSPWQTWILRRAESLFKPQHLKIEILL